MGAICLSQNKCSLPASASAAEQASSQLVCVPWSLAYPACSLLQILWYCSSTFSYHHGAVRDRPEPPDMQSRRAPGSAQCARPAALCSAAAMLGSVDHHREQHSPNHLPFGSVCSSDTVLVLLSPAVTS